MANPDVSAEQIAAWIASPAEHAQSAEAIADLGDAAIPGLRAYLACGPAVVPQPRCFAVAMLARLWADAATEALREVLRAHPLKSLSSTFAESEEVVKSDVMEALCARSYPTLADDIAFGVHERLRAAVVAAARFHRGELADTLIDLLDDDVLADTTMESLVAMGHAASAAMALRLDAWLLEAQDNARRRLALIRALRVLNRIGSHDVPGTTAVRRTLDDLHPAVHAAAALLVWPAKRNETLIEALLHGALGFDRELADDCRAALERVGPELYAPGMRALRRNAEPDLYGEIRPLSSEQRDWLAARLRQSGARPR